VSVPSPSSAQATFCATLVDEWIRCGVHDAVVCPGSRSTPMALALAQRSEVTLHVRIDERSAGFFAIGRFLATRDAVLVLVTSGTAAMELHAAVAEASLAQMSLIVITADRPPELHGVGAPQTVRQRELYGPLVRRFEEPGVARDEASASWRPLASRLWRDASAARRGPVHLNLAFVEPLMGSVQELPSGRGDFAPWHVDDVDVSEVTERRTIAVGSRPLIVCGVGANQDVIDQAVAHGWPVVGDATTAHHTAYCDAYLRDDDVAQKLAPDTIIRTGGLPASKVLAERVRQWSVSVYAVSDSGDLNDPDQLIERSFRGHVQLESRDAATAADFGQLWQRASEVAEEVMSQFDETTLLLSETSVARLLVRLGHELDVPLVVGSSMPVREVEWCTGPPRGTIFSNRGVNGIDGVNSTVLGVGAGAQSIGLVGDVTFLHDVSALSDGLGSRGGSCALVVVDNGGGGIFSFLAQATSVNAETFDHLFSTPRHHDIAAIARGFSHRGCVVETNAELEDEVRNALGAAGLSVIVAKVPLHRENVTLHGELNTLIGDLVRNGLT
jgi:2-succinyl-5-enolpyruvyl-6-hydroxy-3-cyclohexene-1-carboxylate synthase